MNMRYVVLLAVAALAVVPTGPAMAAASVTHIPIHVEEVSTDHFAAGDGVCVDYAGTLVENRVGDADLVLHESGALADAFHVTFVVAADFTLTPDNPNAGPGYSGTYREGGAGLVEGDTGQELTSSFHLIAVATGTDGSTLHFLLRGHVTVTPDGTMRAVSDQLTCIQP
jgi:hypothetical protein